MYANKIRLTTVSKKINMKEKCRRKKRESYIMQTQVVYARCTLGLQQIRDDVTNK